MSYIIVLSPSGKAREFDSRIRWFKPNKGCYIPADKTKSTGYEKCVDWDKTEIKLRILSKWNISGCVYGLIVNVLEVVHSKTKTTKKERKKEVWEESIMKM